MKKNHESRDFVDELWENLCLRRSPYKLATSTVAITENDLRAAVQEIYDRHKKEWEEFLEALASPCPPSPELEEYKKWFK
jgi:hypothetical protein